MLDIGSLEVLHEVLLPARGAISVRIGVFLVLLLRVRLASKPNLHVLSATTCAIGIIDRTKLPAGTAALNALREKRRWPIRRYKMLSDEQIKPAASTTSQDDQAAYTEHQQNEVHGESCTKACGGPAQRCSYATTRHLSSFDLGDLDRGHGTGPGLLPQAWDQDPRHKVSE